MAGFPKRRFYNPSEPVASGGGGGGGVATSVTIQAYDASAGTYPATYAGGAIAAGNMFRVTVASAADGNGDIKFPVNALLIAWIAAPAQLDANWKIMQA